LTGKRKVLIIGLDGATFDIIDPMMEEGKLPNISRLIQQGTRGILQSTIPPNSSVAWSSMMTGKDPGKHGIYYFRERRLGDYRRPLISSRSLKAKTLWKIINEEGGKTGVLNVPVTYPPEPVDGFLISGLLAPHRAANFTHPSSLHLELIKEFGEYPLDNEAQNLFYKGDMIRALEHQIFTSKRLLDVTCWLMDRFPWSFFMTVFTAVDRIQHVAWRYMTEEYARKRPRESEKFRELIPLIYELMDEHVEHLLDRIDQDTALIIMSDHGFGPIRHKFYVNRWLVEQGLLSLKSFPEMRYDPWTVLLDKVGLGHLRRTPPMNMDNAIGRLRRMTLRRADWEGYFDLVDWSKTRVYSTFSSGEEIFFVNLKGREPQGIVDPADYDSVCDEVVNRLMEVKDENGQRVIEKVYRRNELYHGPYLELAPDLQYVTKDYSVLPRSELFAKKVLVEPEDCFPAMHRREGIVIMRAGELRAGFNLGEAHIRDIAPTALYLLDYPVPDDMDGRVLEEAFADKVIEKRSIAVRHVRRADVEGDDIHKRAYSQEEEEDVIQALKGLGYMG
jgi:predicted AlkP superfamily phosphohydrolase/phosphomutase